MTAAIGTTKDSGSHRERKRARTWTAIHLAAVAGATRHERLADVTIEAIAEDAEVSPRTFFNYFKSKEEAVLGLKPPAIDDTIAKDFHLEAGDDILEKVAFLLLAVFRTANARAIDNTEYFALMERHPELAQRRVQHVDNVQAVVTDLVTDRLTGTGLVPEDEDVRAAAEMVVTVAGAVMRTAMQPVLVIPGRPEGEGDAALRRAFALYRKITRA